MNLPNPQYLVTLRAVLSEGSFAAAAHSLGYTPSAVSQQIASLERALGLRLFERKHSAVHATDHALRIAELADEALASWQRIVAYAQEQRLPQRSTVRVGTFATAGARLLPRALSTAAAGQPDIHVSIKHGEPKDLISDLLQERLDLVIAFAYTPIAQQWPSGVEAVELLREEILLAAPTKGSPTGLGAQEARLARLRGADWISTELDTGCSQVLELACSRYGFEPNVVLRTNDYDAMQALVGESLGVALIPALAARRQPNVHHRPITDVDAKRVTMALFRAAEPRAGVRKLVRALESASFTLTTSQSTSHVRAANEVVSNLIAGPLQTTGFV